MRFTKCKVKQITKPLLPGIKNVQSTEGQEPSLWFFLSSTPGSISTQTYPCSVEDGCFIGSRYFRFVSL